MSTLIQNPILRGFNPDPSILRVGEDYYIVTSTFEWFPGYQIHHSRDLRHWRLISRPLRRKSQLDLQGVPDSCGVWAPCLSEHDGTFYLPYSVVRSFDGPFIDCTNYLVTTDTIEGEWSEPVVLNRSGFDASFFHDDDGRSWLLNMVVDHRSDNFFGGIVLQEYDRDARRLVGEIHPIFRGTEHGRTEGPHILKRDGMYYLILAEGGTGYDHCITVARSRSLLGPYEVHPQNPLITARHRADAYLQKTGHGDLVETTNGDWYAVFLASRPLRGSGRGRCTLGRESAIERIVWQDGWPVPASGDPTPRRYVEAPKLPEHPWPKPAERLNFDSDTLDIHFQSLRIPMTDDWVSTKARPGYLRLVGRESLGSTFEQSLIARRVQAHRVEATTCVEFAPSNFQQMAGLVCYYNTYHYHYLHLSGDDFGGDPERKFLDILTCDKYRLKKPLTARIDLTGVERVYLKVEFDHAALRFFYAVQEGDWQAVGPVLDGSILSDDYVEDLEIRYRPCFTGAFIGLCCQDVSGAGAHADFDVFTYREFETPEPGSH